MTSPCTNPTTSLRLLALLALPCATTLFAQTNVNSTLEAAGGTANFGDTATWTNGVPDASNPAVISGAFSANLVLNVLDATATAANYTVGDISFTDTTTTFRDLQIGSAAGGILTLGNPTNTWTFGTTGGGLFQLLANAKLVSTESQTLVLTSENPLITTTSSISSGGFRFNNTWSTWGTGNGATDGFLGSLVLAKGSFYTTNNKSVFGTNGLAKAITLGTDTNVAAFQIAADQTLSALNGNAQSFIFHNAGSTARRILFISGGDNGNFAGTVGSNGNAGFANQGLSIRKSGPGTQVFSGPIVGSNVEVTVSDGVLELSGANTFTTAGVNIINVSGGTLRAASASALSSGTLNINGGTLTSTVASITSGGATLANGTLALNGSSAGTLTLATDTNFVMSGGTLNYSVGDQIAGAGVGTFTLSGGTLDLGGSISNYNISYNLFTGFASGTVDALLLSITGYDNANWTAALDSTGTLSFTPAVTMTALETWRLTHFDSTADSGPGADANDPDSDGLPNLLEYAVGSSPRETSAPAFSVALADGRLALTFQRIADPTLTYTVQVATDLAGTWTTLDVPGNPSTGAANVAGSVTVTDSELAAAQPRRFLRLVVTR